MVLTKSLPLDADHFNFDLTEGFEMAVEKDWNVLDIATINKDFPIYDADLRPHLPSKYAVRLFFKACIPMCYVDPETYETNPLVKDADNASFEGKYLDLIDGTVLGSPVDKMSQGSTSEQSYGEFGYHGLLIADDVPDNKEAYALPTYRQLNHTNITLHDFATGSSIASCKLDGGYYQPKDVALYTENVKGFAYMLMNKGGYNAGGVASFIVNNGALAYSIDTSGNRMNLPLDDDYVENYKYLQPLLFKPFGVAFADHLTLNGGTDVDTAGWFYCVLGVNEITDEPTYEVTVEPVAGNVTLFDHLVSTFQSDVDVIDNSIVGDLDYVENFAPSGPLAGSGNYLALQFSDIPEEADSVKVGLNPSQGSGLVEILTDPDKNGVFKITDKDTQVFVVKTSVNGQEYVQTFDLSSLVCEAAPEPPGPTPSEPTFLISCSNADTDIETEEGVSSYSGEVSGTASDPFVITVAVDPEIINDVSYYPFKVNNSYESLTIDYDTGIGTCTLTGANVPDISNGLTIEFTAYVGEDSYSYTIEYDYVAPSMPVLDIYMDTNASDNTKYDCKIYKSDLLDNDTPYTTCYFDFYRLEDGQIVRGPSWFTLETDWSAEPVVATTLPATIEMTPYAKQYLDICDYLDIWFSNDILDPSGESHINGHMYELNKIIDGGNS